MRKPKEKMIDEMALRGLSDATQTAYLYAVRRLTQYHNRSPDLLSKDEIKLFFIFLTREKKLSASSVRQMINGVFFYYYKVLKWPHFTLDIPLPKVGKTQPEILNPIEVANIIGHTQNLKQKTALMTAYSTGVRVGELVSLRVSDIDSDRMVIRVEQGKGKKDRYTILTPTLLTHLREYYRQYRPKPFLFSGQPADSGLSTTTIGKYFKRSCERAKITKKVSFHSLRHAFATHQILSGMAATELQLILGHSDLRTTMRYVHLAKIPTGKDDRSRDLLCLLDQIEGRDNDIALNR